MRLLWLARRTRQLPEFLIGTALVGTNFLFFPMAGASGMVRIAVGEVHLGLFAAAMLVLWLGVSCLIAFTWRTFRPNERWAKVLVLLLSGLLLGLVGGLAGLFQVAIQATSLGLHVRGLGILADPLSLLVVATGALIAATMMFLVFLPPAAYRSFVERRAGEI